MAATRVQTDYYLAETKVKGRVVMLAALRGNQMGGPRAENLVFSMVVAMVSSTASTMADQMAKLAY